MTTRKPPGASWESWVEQAIREGQSDGLFDNLAGSGERTLGIEDARDEDWWIKEKLKREDLSYLPPTLAIRKDVQDARAAIAVARRESAVREILAEINGRIREINAKGAAGPPSTVMPLDVERTVAEWRDAHGADPVDDQAGPVGGSSIVDSPSGRSGVGADTGANDTGGSVTGHTDVSAGSHRRADAAMWLRRRFGRSGRTR